MKHGFVAALTAFLLGAPAAAQAPSAQDLAREQARWRAAEAVIWGAPAVNTDLMLQAALDAGAKPNEIIYWSRPVDWRNQSLTPNPDAIYLMTFLDTADGPVVIDVPPAGDGVSFTGNIDDVWQMPLEDVGPIGADKGAGGKYLVLPPGYDGTVPPGYIALPMRTRTGYALIRSNLRTHGAADVAAAVAYGKRLQVYPLAQAANPPPTRFTDAADVLFDSTIPYDIRFFESLHRVIQTEPWLERDMALVDPLKSLGIEKGKPFAPDAATRAALLAGVQDAHTLLHARVDTTFEPYFEGRQWFMPATPEMVRAASGGYADPGSYPIDARGVTYTMGYVGIKRLGTAQFYLLTPNDKAGRPLDGGSSYKLTVPPDAPVDLYWSVTAYSRETHALIRDLPRASRSSQLSEMRRNRDGSTDIYFGPQAPAGQEANWVPTKPGEPFELMFRLYGPTQRFFDKGWILPDVEKVPAR